MRTITVFRSVSSLKRSSRTHEARLHLADFHCTCLMSMLCAIYVHGRPLHGYMTVATSKYIWDECDDAVGQPLLL